MALHAIIVKEKKYNPSSDRVTKISKKLETKPGLRFQLKLEDIPQAKRKLKLASSKVLESVASDIRTKLKHLGKDITDADFSEVALLFSIGGCEKQIPHFDYKLQNCVDIMPYGVLVAIDDTPTRFIVYPETGECQGGKKVVTEEILVLRQSEILIFKGSLLHAGADYSEANFRLHGYYSRKAGIVPHNNTYLYNPDDYNIIKKYS